MIDTGRITKETTLEIDVYSNMFKQQLEGAFKVRRRTLADEGKISQMLADMTGGTEIVDAHARSKLTAIATLSVVILDYPDWWKQVEELADMGVILHVFARYQRWIINPFEEETES